MDVILFINIQAGLHLKVDVGDKHLSLVFNSNEGSLACKVCLIFNKEFYKNDITTFLYRSFISTNKTRLTYLPILHEIS